jgi:hypothetical protein
MILENIASVGSQIDLDIFFLVRNLEHLVSEHADGQGSGDRAEDEDPTLHPLSLGALRL